MDAQVERIIETESGADDAFVRASKAEPPALKSKFVSSNHVAIGEGVKLVVDSCELVPNRFSDDDGKVIEIKGQVLESRAAGLIDSGEITVTCSSVRLEQFGNAVAAAGVGSIATLVRGEDDGKAVGWRWFIDTADGNLPMPDDNE